ncbi:MAG: SAM-dependent methyltransferase [Frankiales bacterium]|nr:SAM-dependent methyltransferase [Frankiales bacterium]
MIQDDTPAGQAADSTALTHRSPLTDPVDLAYFDAQYQHHEDPWHIRDSWYETRKRGLVLAALDRPSYANGFEPGCSVGEITAALAPRCRSLLAVDAHVSAVETTRRRLGPDTHVMVAQAVLPNDWSAVVAPSGPFDLVVVSEIGYFFTPVAWREFCSLLSGGLTADATVLACHWRPDFAERTMATAELHEILGDALGRPVQSTLTDADFSLQVWAGAGASIAERDGLR